MLGAGESGTVVLDKTPFYAQSGGQVGDSGVIKNGEDNAFIVADTAKNADSVYLHKGEVSRGIISVGDSVFASINAARRKSIMRNHTLLIFSRLRFVRFSVLMLNRQVSLLMNRG